MDIKKGGKVRVSMSAAVANDLEAFKKGVINFAEEIGCPACFSGLDCTFESAREFAITPEFRLQQVKPAHERATRGLGTRALAVPLTTEQSFELKFVLGKIDLIGKRLGSHWEQGGPGLCCSGFDVTFGRETELSVPTF